jgi:chromate transport protein ChrA
MEEKNKVGGVAFVLAAICIIGSVAASLSLREIIPHLNKWQEGGYAIVGGIFIAATVVIVNQMLSFFRTE